MFDAAQETPKVKFELRDASVTLRDETVYAWADDRLATLGKGKGAERVLAEAEYQEGVAMRLKLTADLRLADVDLPGRLALIDEQAKSLAKGMDGAQFFRELARSPRTLKPGEVINLTSFDGMTLAEVLAVRRVVAQARMDELEDENQKPATYSSLATSFRLVESKCSGVAEKARAVLNNKPKT